MSRQRLEYLFIKYFNNSLSAEEKDEFRIYLNDPSNDALLKELMLKAWNGMNSSGRFYSIGQSEDMLERILNTHRMESPESAQTKRSIVSVSRVAAAAVITVLLSIGIYWFSKDSKVSSPTENNILAFSEKVVPGSDKAILTRSDGSTIVLDSVNDGELAVDDKTQVIKVNGM